MRCHDSHPGSATRKVNKQGAHTEIVVHRRLSSSGSEMPVGAVRTAT